MLSVEYELLEKNLKLKRRSQDSEVELEDFKELQASQVTIGETKVDSGRKQSRSENFKGQRVTRRNLRR